MLTSEASYHGFGVPSQGAFIMADFVRICSAAELPRSGAVGEYMVSGRAFCVANIGGSIAVLDGVCPHEGGPLGEGIIEDGRVVCPWHGYSFDVHSGVAQQDPEAFAQVFEAKVEAGELRAKI
jgi:nitrite reductase (NADH) small subunit